ncbi:MAG: hypothetical protein ABFD54_15230 [Armatimonadota bacterium]
MRSIVLALCALTLFTIVAPIGATTLVGQWDFEGTTPLANKATGVTWDPLTLYNSAAVSEGKLVLPKNYSNGIYTQAYATTMLKTDLGTSGYFKEMTIVAWFYWPGFETAHLGRIVNLSKLSSNTYMSSFKACQGIMYGSWNSDTWRGSRKYEYMNGTTLTSSSPLYDSIEGATPSTTRLIKMAMVLRQVDENNYQDVIYWDTGDGLVQLGDAITIPAANINSYGQCGSECLVPGAPTGNKRYDAFALMDSLSGSSTKTGNISFEEVRLYSGALTTSDITALSYNNQPNLVGQWTFDNLGGTDALQNKAAGTSWSTMSVGNVGSGGVEDGKLRLTRYQSGDSWNQNSATASLLTDFGPSGYFKEQTQVAWIYWPGFTPDLWSQIMSISKRGSGAADLSWLWQAPDGTGSAEGWGSRYSYESTSSGQLSTISGSFTFLGSEATPPTDRLFKVAFTLKQRTDGNYEQAMYWDTGSGLTRVGNTCVISANQVSAYGQSGSNCLVSPMGGKRYDSFNLMGYSWAVPSVAGDIYYDEARLYSGALEPGEIDAITLTPRPDTDRLAGCWTFDYSGNNGPLYNKVSWINWDTLSLSSSGAEVRDGKLHLSAYQSQGTWTLGQASATLRSSRTPYSDKSFVMWLTLDKSGDSDDVAGIFRLRKNATTNQPYEGIDWSSQFYPEVKSSAGGITSAYPYASNPMSIPRGKEVKLAVVVKNDVDALFTVTYYVDKMDGTGPQVYGSPMRFNDSYLTAFGTANDDTVQFAPIMQNLTGKTFAVSIDEARVYEVALTQDEIGGLLPSQRPVPVAAHLIGEWTFDSRGGDDARYSKAPDTSWSSLGLSTAGAAFIDGQLRFSAYQSGSKWLIGNASATLASDMPAYREKTYTMWLSISGADADDSIDLLKLFKSQTSNQPGDRICWSNGQFCVIARNTWSIEAVGYPYVSNPPAIPVGKLVKLVAVWNDLPGSQFTVTFYLDKLDGSGLQPYGSPLSFNDAYLASFGDSNDDSVLMAPAVANVTSSNLVVNLEEARIYDKALTQAEIDKLAARQPSEFLSRNGSSLSLNGFPYRAFGFNLPDLFTKYAPLGFDSANYSSVEDQRSFIAGALADAGQHRVPLLRFWCTGFWPVDMALYFNDPEEYWTRMDEVFALAKQNGIRLVPSLYFNSTMWPMIFGETYQSMINPASQSYKAMHDYGREVILRYRDDPTVLMWEISNEMYLGADLNQTGNSTPGLGVMLPGSPGYANYRSTLVLEDSTTTNVLLQFYNDINNMVKSLDPNHLLESGDSMRRDCSESLRTNFPNTVWRTDTLSQNLTNLRISQEMLDMYCMHEYVGSDNTANAPGRLTYFDFYRQENLFAQSQGKPCFVGETGQSEPSIDQDPSATYLLPLLNSFEQDGVDLIAIWTWYFTSHFPQCYYTGSLYPNIMQWVQNFNDKYAQPTFAITNRAAYDAITKSSVDKYDWTLWGKVTVINTNEFTIDDGSGMPVRVIYSGHGLSNGNYVTVRGRLNNATNPAVVSATSLTRVSP